MKKHFLSLIILPLLLTSCMDQPGAPIDYGSTASSSSNSHSSQGSDDIVEKPLIREKTQWGDKEIETIHSDYPPALSDTPPTLNHEAPLRTETISHEVIEGETIDTLAKQYDIDREAIIKANKLKAPYALEELQILKIPPQTSPEALSSEALVGDNISPKSINSSAKIVSIFPVAGKIISKFGDNYLGAKNNGINIAAPIGTDVHASRAGKVVYAGSDAKFGNLVIIKSLQDENFMAYSHLNDLMIHKEDVVSEGQLIGHVGQTGNVTSPQLHFAVRQGKTPIDPEKYLLSN